MNIIIIEDEPKAAKLLERIILSIKPGSRVIGQHQSVERSVEALSTGVQPDLIFMDIQLADGLCFEIFKSVRVTCPIVLCTGWDEYALEAFRTCGVEYVLKPFSDENINCVFNRIGQPKSLFRQRSTLYIGDAVFKLTPPGPRTVPGHFRKRKCAAEQTAYSPFKKRSWLHKKVLDFDYQALFLLKEVFRRKAKY